MHTIRLLFVCTGNICRSPTAEAVMRKAIEDAGLSQLIECDSAGLEQWHVGKAPDPRAVRAASQRGYEMIELRARLFDRQDYCDFDLLIGMDAGHVTEIERARPRGATARTARFLEFSPKLSARVGPDVPDPYLGPEADFEYALDLIEQGTPGLLAAVRALLR
jgi:protein-tyrosine phosphatase